MSANSEDAVFLKRWLDEIEQSPWLGPRAQEKRQRRRLGVLLRHARQNVPFYRDRLDCVFRADGQIDWDKWNEIPVVTRDDVRSHMAELTSSFVPQGEGEVREGTTSGSSGTPLQHYKSHRDVLRADGLVYRTLKWHGLDPARKFAWITPKKLGEATYPLGDRFSHWSLTTQTLGIEGELITLNINTPTRDQIEWLTRERPVYLHTFPNNLMGLARELERQGTKISFIEKVWCIGETLSDEIRAAARTYLSAEAFDTYGASEVGPVAAPCPEHALHHAHGEAVLLEVLDANSEPCAPGEPGAAVATSFYNFAFPLIRYRMGDQMVAGGTCPCGRVSPVIQEILGRERNLFRFPDGSELWPNFGAPNIARHLGPLHRWQVAQIEPLTIEIRYVPENTDRERDFDALTDYIRQLLKQDVTVRYRECDDLPVAASGKFHDYVCEL